MNEVSVPCTLKSSEETDNNQANTPTLDHKSFKEQK